MNATSNGPARSTAAAAEVGGCRFRRMHEHQKLMNDLLHDVSQPLSTLTCLLEVNLMSRRTAKQSRHDLEIALKQVRCVISLVRRIRELVQARNSNGNCKVLSPQQRRR